MSGKWSMHVLLVLILFAGLSLRLWGIDYGLPLLFYPDEQYIIGAVLSFASGNLHPPNFEYPTFLSYLTYFSSELFFISGQNLFGIHMLGRALVAVFGALSIFLIYWMGKELFDRTVGILSAALFAFYELHIEYSHYTAVDVPLTCLLLVSFCFLTAAHRSGARKYLWCAVVAAGCAMSTKYTGAIAFLPIISWIAIRERQQGVKKVFQLVTTVLILGGISFLLFTPYALLDSTAFMRDLLGQQSHSRIGHLGFESKSYFYLLFNSENPLYSGNSLWATTNPLMFTILALGLGYGTWSLFTRRELLPGLLFLTCIVGYVFLNSYTTKFVRWILPFTPLLIIFGSAFLHRLVTAILPRAAEYIFVAIVSLSFLFAVSAATKFSMIDTRTLATAWVQENIPQGEMLHVDPFSVHVDNAHWFSRNLTLPKIGPYTVVQNPVPVKVSSGYVVTSSYYRDRYWYPTSLKLRPDESRKAREYYLDIERRGKVLAVFKPGENLRGPDITIYEVTTSPE